MRKKIFTKNWKKILAAAFLTILTISAYFVFFTAEAVKAEWFNDAWLYRREIQISGNSSALVDIQYQVTGIDTQGLFNEGKLQADCRDIRFTDVQGNLLDYWVEEVDLSCGSSASTDIWVRIPDIPSTGTTIYMYYGNPSAESYSNGEQTFEFFDDFGDTAPTTYEFDNFSSLGDPSVTTGILTLSDSATTEAILSNQTFDTSSRLVFRSKQDTTSTGPLFQGFSNSSLTSSFDNDDSAYYFTDDGTNDGANFLRGSSNEGTVSESGATTEDASFNVFELGVNSSGVDYYINNSSDGSISTNVPDEDMHIRLENAELSEALEIDWIAVANYADDPADTQIIGNEEVGPGPIIHLDFNDVEGSTVYDKSGQGNNGILQNNPSIVDECINDRCMHLDGTGQYIDINTEIGTEAPFTYSVWVLLEGDTGNNQYIVGNGAHTDTEGGTILFDTATEEIKWVVVDNNYKGEVTAGIEYNEWTHLLGTWDGTNTTNSVKLYINGELKASGTPVNITEDPQIPSLRIGLPDNSIATQLNPEGLIDEVKLWPRALSEQEVLNEYNSVGNAVAGDSPNRLRDGLIGWWKMDESSGTTAIDSSKNGNNGIYTNGLSSSSGVYGNSRDFDGSNDYIDLGSSTQLGPISEVSVAAWVNVDSLANNMTIYDAGSAANGYWSFMVTTGGNLMFRADGQVTVTSTGTIGINTWHHVAVVKENDPSGTVSFYIDGQLVGEDEIGSIINSGTKSIGRRLDGTSQLNYFDGEMDDVRLYNKSLDQQDVLNTYNYAPGPVAHWKLDERTGTTADDSSLNAYDGTLNNMDDSDWVAGRLGNALDFDGVDDIINTPFSLPSNNTTIAAWVNTSVPATTQMAVGQESTTSASANGIRIVSSQIQCRKHTVSGSVEVNSTTTVSSNTWYHAVCTYSPIDGMKLYVDGILEAESTDTNDMTLSSTYDTHIGGHEYSVGSINLFEGIIDDVRVYDYTLQQEQVEEIFITQGGSIPNAPNDYIGYYDLEEGSGQVLNNKGTNGGIGYLGDSSSSESDDPDWSSSCKRGNHCLDFSAPQNDNALLGSNNDYLVGNEITWSVWIRPDVTSGDRSIMEKRRDSPGSGRQTVIFKIRGNDLSAWLRSTSGGGTEYIASSSNLVAGNWYHAVLVKDGSLWSIYQDGSLMRQWTRSGNYSTNEMPLHLGYNEQTKWDYDGLMDEVKIWDRALSGTEIKNLYDSYGTSQGGKELRTIRTDTEITTSSNPLLHLKLDEKSGTNAADASGNGYNGTLQNMSGDEWRRGKLGSALEFDGADDYISVSDTAGFNWSNTLTTSAWFKTNTTTNRQIITSKANASSNYEFEMSVETDGRVRCWISTTGTNQIVAYSRTFDYANDEWNQATCVYDGQEVIVYVNGEAGTGVAGSGNIHNGGEDITIGDNPLNSGTVAFAGKIDNLKVWDNALTPREVAIEYNGGAPVGYWKFDEGEGSTAYDYSGNGNHGTLTNMDPAADWVAGRKNGGLDFDGVNDNLTTNGDIPSNNLSIGVWVKRDNSANFGYILTQMSALSANGSGLGINSDGTIRCRKVDTANVNVNYDSVGQIPINEWIYVNCVYEEGVGMKIYINGKLDSINTTSLLPISVSSSMNLNIGAYRWTSGINAYFGGQLDELKIFNYPLSEEDILREYNLNSSLRFE
ncbi:MAG: DUF2341 domain-containing protein [Candidatus Dojkabacteria bacterium]